MQKKLTLYYLVSSMVVFLWGIVPAVDARQGNSPELELSRRERQEKMPYLDEAFIRAELSAEKIEDRKAFLSGHDKTLEELIQRAVSIHTPARAARERISLSRRRIFAALRALFPEASLEFNEKEGLLSTDKFNSLNYRFKFKQPLFRGGILWNTLLQEKAGLEAAEKEYEASVADLMKEVAIAYFEYSRALEVIQTQEKVGEEMKRYADVSEKKNKEGIISEIEHLNTQSLFSQVQYDHETSKQELELAKLDLQKYLGLDLVDQVSIVRLYDVEELLGNQDLVLGKDTSAIDGGKTFPALVEMVDLAYLHRPELRVEAAKLESARLEERIRWGKMVPQADAVLEFGKLGEAFDAQDITPSLRKEFRFMLEFNWNIGANKVGYTFENDEKAPSVTQFQAGSGSQTSRNTMTLGILDGLQDFAETKEAEVAKLDQVTQLEKMEKEVIQSVKQSYFDYEKARIQMRSSLQRADYRRRLTLLSKHKLEKNEIQISEYLQSQNDYLQEVTSLHKAISDYFSAKAKLNHSLGMPNYLPIEAIHGRR